MGQALKHHPCRGASAPGAPTSELPTRSERLSPGQVTHCSSQARWNHIVPPLVINMGTAHSAGQTPISRAPGSAKYLMPRPRRLSSQVPGGLKCPVPQVLPREGGAGPGFPHIGETQGPLVHQRGPQSPGPQLTQDPPTHQDPQRGWGPQERTVGFFLRSRIAS